MEPIDLTSTQIRDESCEYVDLNNTEIEVFESQFTEDTKEIIHDELYSDKSLTDTHDVTSVEFTKAKLRNLQLDQCFTEEKSSKKDPDSLEQKLSRIRDELKDIRITMQDPVDSPELQALEDLHRKLLSTSHSKMMDLRRKLQETATKGTDPDLVVLPRIAMNFEDCKRILQLDQRVSELETTVGISTDLENDDNRSVATKLEVLSRQIRLLKNDSDTLSQFHEKLAQIDKDYKNSLTGRKAKTDAKLYDVMRGEMMTQETKIEELYKYHELLENYGPIFPQLLNRIKHLSSICDTILESYDLARSMNTNITDLQSQANKWDNILVSIEKKLDQQEINMNKNIAYISKKMVLLEKNED